MQFWASDADGRLRRPSFEHAPMSEFGAGQPPCLGSFNVRFPPTADLTNVRFPALSADHEECTEREGRAARFWR